MARVSVSLMLVVLLAGACAGMGGAPAPSAWTEGACGLPELASCEPEQAEVWAAQEGLAPRLRAAGCYARLAEDAEDPGQGLAWAQAGWELSRAAAQMAPANATARYLAAYLAGLVAERKPMQGLALVPVIQEHAQAAVELDPEIDQAGPHRILGELLLQAPGFPVSVGDPFGAVQHFRLAVRLAPNNVDNRLGLVASLLETDQDAKACRELAPVLEAVEPANMAPAAWSRAVRLFENICKKAPAGAEE